MSFESITVLTPCAPAPAARKRRTSNPDRSCGDPRFRRLLSEADWAALSPAVRRRFARRLPARATALYVGEICYTRMSFAGRLICAVAGLIGAPLPRRPGGSVAASVAVTECADLGGQVWTRVYSRPGRFPQVIQSTKRFSGPTGLEEVVRGGVGMELTVHAGSAALRFRSRGYFFELRGRRVPLPRFVHPGVLTVTHTELDSRRFRFELTIDHPWFGRVLEQSAEFRDAAAVCPRRFAGPQRAPVRVTTVSVS